MIVNGWGLDGPPQRQYAFVAPPDEPFTPTGPFAGFFEVSGDAGDEDVVALTDIVGRFAPQYRISRLDARDDRRSPSVLKHLAKISCVSKDDEIIDDGSRPPGLQVSLEKSDGRWVVTKIEVGDAPSFY